jgi:hypothetical protein
MIRLPDGFARALPPDGDRRPASRSDEDADYDVSRA